MSNKIYLYNHSSYPTNTISYLIKLGSNGIEYSSVVVCVINCINPLKPFQGCAWSYVPDEIKGYYSSEALFYVEIKIGRRDCFPMIQQYPGINTAPKYKVNSWKEAIVSVAAHELTHCNQYVFNKVRSELECEHAAITALNKYKNKVNHEKKNVINSTGQLLRIGCYVEFIDKVSDTEIIPSTATMMIKEIDASKNMAKVYYGNQHYWVDIKTIKKAA